MRRRRTALGAKARSRGVVRGQRRPVKKTAAAPEDDERGTPERGLEETVRTDALEADCGAENLEKLDVREAASEADGNVENPEKVDDRGAVCEAEGGVEILEEVEFYCSRKRRGVVPRGRLYRRVPAGRGKDLLAVRGGRGGGGRRLMRGRSLRSRAARPEPSRTAGSDRSAASGGGSCQVTAGQNTRLDEPPASSDNSGDVIPREIAVKRGTARKRPLED